MGSHMGSVLVSPFPLEANGNRNGVMDGQNQIPNVVKVGSVCRHTGKHTETSLFLSSARAKAWQRVNQRNPTHYPPPALCSLNLIFYTKSNQVRQTTSPFRLPICHSSYCV